ncbi:MAG: hypothetical protein CMH57_06170 [Myxococcales bacterium]|nr:hypothetical protein [Myxococcales bacterium]
MKTFRSILTLLGFALCLGCVACGSGSEEAAPVSAAAPVVERFAASAAEVRPGALVELSWSVRDGSRATIKADGVIVQTFLGEEARAGTLAVRPTQTVRYVLEVVHAPDGRAASPTVSEEVLVRVLAAEPRPVLTLRAEPAMLERGERSSLLWTVRHASRLELTANGAPRELEGDALEGGQLEVSPEINTTYVMTATGPGGRVSEEVSITVRSSASVLDFRAEPEEIPLGAESVLRWRTQGAHQVQLSDEEGALPVSAEQLEEGAIVVAPERDQVYTLTVKGAVGEAREAQVTVRVLQPAEVTSFTVEPERVRAGEPITLRWGAVNADEVSIWRGGARLDEGGLDPAEGSWTTTAERSGTFRLKVSGPGGGASAEATLEVVAPVAIDVFRADPAMVEPGSSSTLWWETTGATQVALVEVNTGRPLAVPADAVDGSWSVTPTALTRYALTAQGPGGTLTRELEVGVQLEGRLRIISFTVSPESIEPGQEATLSWQVAGASAVSIATQRGGALVPDELSPLTGTLPVSPEQTTRYVLRATGETGVIERDVVLTVTRAVEIGRFEASPEVLSPGEGTTLGWTVHNAASVELAYGDERLEVESQGTLRLDEVTETTEVTLTASGLGGPLERRLEVVVADFGLADAVADALTDAQLSAGRRRGPESGGNRVVLEGYGLDLWPMQVWFGESEAECDVVEEGAGALECVVPPGAGRVALVLETPYGARRYPGWYVYEPVDRCALVGPLEVVGRPGSRQVFTGWALEPGLTEVLEELLLVAEWGYGPAGTDPAWPGAAWEWFEADTWSPCEGCGEGLRFEASAELPGDAGVYSHAFRVRPLLSELWTYCDGDGTFNDTFREESNAFEPEAAGTLTVE